MQGPHLVRRRVPNFDQSFEIVCTWKNPYVLQGHFENPKKRTKTVQVAPADKYIKLSISDVMGVLNVLQQFLIHYS